MKVAINIETEIWSNIIKVLKEESWEEVESYMGGDAGIDFDFLILKRRNEQIQFGWGNFEEGEIKCKRSLFHYLENKFELTFEYGEAKNLSLEVICITRIATLPQRLLRNLGILKFEA